MEYVLSAKAFQMQRILSKNPPAYLLLCLIPNGCRDYALLHLRAELDHHFIWRTENEVVFLSPSAKPEFY